MAEARKLDLKSDIKYLKGVGPKSAASLQKLGITTVGDFVTYYPRAYEDRSCVTSIGDLMPENEESIYTVIGVIVNIKEKLFGRNRSILMATISDGTGYLQVNWFNQRFLKKSLTIGKRILVYGKIGYAYGGRGMMAVTRLISFELLEPGEAVPQQGILPVYQATESINQRYIRRLMENLWQSGPQIGEIIPQKIREKYRLLPRQEALHSIHYPKNNEELARARESLAFEELYVIQCGLLLLKKDSQQEVDGIRHLMSGSLVKSVIKSLPFSLTDDQSNAWQDIEKDMERNVPMRRLLEGDVGSGKTVIALLALVKTVENGYQGAFMAPTEILARQHFAKFSEMLSGTKIRVGLLVGSLTAKNRRETLEKIAAHELDIVIGTHAVIQDDVHFDALGLAVTDEQHRFGISQRAALDKKGEHSPDVLVMTATPIPRTMTLTVYGDLDVSRIEHLPPGRQPIRTFVRESDRRQLIYEFVKKEIEAGRQAYVVCPLIEESESSDENSHHIPSAEEVYAELSQGIFRNIPVGLVHGRLKKDEKQQTMDDFYGNRLKLLVATTVIEVGVDVPNASIMVIENADRFGLAQLHQLRGRIGRGPYSSYCILVAGSKSPLSRERLEVLRDTSSGFEVAEADLRLRGAGQFFGTMQHGAGDLKIVNVMKDTDILLRARQAALETMADSKTLESIRPYLTEKYKDKFSQINDA
ncbi:MAG: ATP-dependent DNA helicase RecG [Selenomonadaceae bacterium]|nr:ATP-dependent DNA helicase RecG [Selenomonadaceae bacterium]